VQSWAWRVNHVIVCEISCTGDGAQNVNTGVGVFLRCQIPGLDPFWDEVCLTAPNVAYYFQDIELFNSLTSWCSDAQLVKCIDPVLTSGRHWYDGQPPKQVLELLLY
jgi:hypothetical protein